MNFIRLPAVETGKDRMLGSLFPLCHPLSVFS